MASSPLEGPSSRPTTERSGRSPDLPLQGGFNSLRVSAQGTQISLPLRTSSWNSEIPQPRLKDITAHFESWLSQAHLPVQTSLVEAVMERLISKGVGSLSQFSSFDQTELDRNFQDPGVGSNRGLASQTEAAAIARRVRELAVRTADKAWSSVPLRGQEAPPGNQGWEVVANSLSKILESRKKTRSSIMDADHSDD